MCIDSIKFTANVMLEVFEKEDQKGNLFVGIRYNNKPIALTANSMYLGLKEFIDLLESNVSDDITKYCGFIEPMRDKSRVWIEWGIYIGIAIAVVLVLILMISLREKGQEKKKYASLTEKLQF